MQETQAQSLGRQDPLEKEMATHSSILAWRIPRTEEPGRLQSMGSHRVGHDWATNTNTKLFDTDSVILPRANGWASNQIQLYLKPRGAVFPVYHTGISMQFLLIEQRQNWAK